MCFTKDVVEDLGRRDFTVNAMAMNLRGSIRDPYHGQQDLSDGVLRCVGDPDKRFREDALRMLRGLRFSAQLGFSIEESTRQAINRNAPYIDHVAAERVQVELTKTLLSPRPQVIGEMLRLGLLNRFIDHPERAQLSDIAALPANRPIRYARLMGDLVRCGAVCDAEATMRTLRMDKATIQAVKNAVAMECPADQTGMKQLMSRTDGLTVNCVCALGDYDRLIALRDDILRNGEPYCIAQLAVTGSDLKALRISGSAVGVVLRKLLDAVIEQPELNEKEILLKTAQSLPLKGQT